ncbi:epoxide hydrolase, partial [Trifolium medium]|nr:epoxide hydrolase [Trifolium medium]
KMEAELAEVGAAYFLRNVITMRKTGPPILPKGGYGTGFNPDTPDILPSWLSEQELDYYVTKFNKTGFTGALNYYRNLQLNWELTSPWSNVAEVNVPVKFITGDVDLVYTSPGMKEYIHDGGFKKDVPGLVEVVVQKGIAHFNNQEAAQDISNHIYDFIQKF